MIKVTFKNNSLIFFMSHPFNKRIARKKCQHATIFCTTSSSSSSSSHVSHFTTTIFFSSKKERKLCFISNVRELSSRTSTRKIFLLEQVGHSTLSFARMRNFFLCVSFSHFLLAIHPKNLCFFGVFSLSLILFYVHICMCVICSINFILMMMEEILIKERSSMTLIAKNSLSIFFLSCPQ